jgi:hypothetical protein
VNFGNLRSRIQRLENARSAQGTTPDWWSFVAFLEGRPLPAAEQAYWEAARKAREDSLSGKCRAAGVDPIELKIEAILACPRGAAAEVIEAKMWEILNGPRRPRCGLVELAPDPAVNTTGLTPRSTNGGAKQD